MRIAKIEPDLRLHSQSKLQQEPLTMKDQIWATSGIQSIYVTSSLFILKQGTIRKQLIEVFWPRSH